MTTMTGPLQGPEDARKRMFRYIQESSNAVRSLESYTEGLYTKALALEGVALTQAELEDRIEELRVRASGPGGVTLTQTELEDHIEGLRVRAKVLGGVTLARTELETFHEYVYHVLNRVTVIGVAWLLIAHFQGWANGD